MSVAQYQKALEIYYGSDSDELGTSSGLLHSHHIFWERLALRIRSRLEMPSHLDPERKAILSLVWSADRELDQGAVRY